MRRKQKNKQHRQQILTIIVCAMASASFLYWYLSASAPTLPEPPLKDLATAHGIELGAHVLAKRVRDKPIAAILAAQFSFVTIDGEAHFASLRPSPTRYNFTNADRLVSFAKANNISVQIHHLIWGEQNLLPNWLKYGNYSQQQVLDFMHSDITNVVGHYRGQVAEWSVVNEAFTRAQHTYGLRDWWADSTGGGTGYIDDTFIWAHQADPNTKLLLNDFNNETEGSISNTMYAYIKAARARGVPIDGIGMQMHIDASKPPSKQAMIKNMQRFKAIGVPTYITEFDVNVNAVKGSKLYKSQLESQITANLVRTCIESKSCVSFNEFGLTDKESLLKWAARSNSRSYLFDSRYHPKPSFYAMRQAWHEL